MSFRKIVGFSVLVTPLSLLPGACDESASTPAYDRAALLDEVAHKVMLPGYQAVAEDAAALHDATGALCDDPSDATVKAARGAWRTAFLDWQRTEAYRFGPARDDSYASEMAYWPIEPSDVEAQISGSDALSADAIDALGSGAKGLYALEYLLFADDDTTAALMDTRRCTYVDLLADHVERISGELAEDWQPDGGDFAGVLATAGQSGNSTYPAELSAVSAVLTELLTVVENLKDRKLGDPLGLTAVSEDPDPSAVESPYAHLSVEAMQANMEGLRAVWKSTKHNFDEYLRTRDSQIADTMRQDLDAVDATLAKVPVPFFDYVSEKDHAKGVAARDAVAELQRTITTDVDTTLAVSLMFNSNDGD